jgi:hypothetical protein
MDGGIIEGGVRTPLTRWGIASSGGGRGQKERAAVRALNMKAGSRDLQARSGMMRCHRGGTDLLAGLVVTLLLIGGGHAVAAPTGPSTLALTTDEAIACIRTATPAHAGLIKGVEGEDKKGQRLCEVKIVDEAGKRHKLQVDVQTQQVVKAK